MVGDNSVRNEDGIWINTKVFTEEADRYRKEKRYCPHPWGSSSWYDYWSEQLSRCTHGYRSGGAFITGDHYFYLNFCQIKLVENLGEAKNKFSSADKQRDFPAFWDGDYNYFHHMRLARYGAKKGYGLSEDQVTKLQLEFYPRKLDGGYHLCVGKARRKGFSYKNAAIVVNRYNTVPDSINIVGAFDKKYLYPEGTMGMCNNYITWLDGETGWAKSRDFVNQIHHKKASYAEKNERGVPVEQGFMSQIMAVSFKDNPDAARGKDGTLILFEEAGKWPNLIESIDATIDALTSGIYVTGQIVVFGTSGDMESDSVPFSKLFYEPEPRGFLAYDHIWSEDNVGNSCSFFFPDYQNKEGFIDKQGNSDIKGAKEHEMAKRKAILEESSSSSAYNQRLQEHPFSPEEAFLISGTSGFPIRELKAQADRVRNRKLHKLGTPFLLTMTDGVVHAEPDLEGKTSPIWDFPLKKANIEGATVIYEPPIDNPPPGLYKIGFDPYQQDIGTSLGAAYVYKGHLKFSSTSDRIVASTVGRARTTDDMSRRVELLARLYNASVMHENMTKDVFTYFRQSRALKYLAKQPDEVIKAAVKDSKVRRVYGVHMNTALRQTAEKYLVKWLLTVRDYDTDGKPILNLETIYDPALLKELISYNRKGNFDRVDALLILMLYLEDESYGREYNPPGAEEEASIYDQLNELMEVQKHLR